MWRNWIESVRTCNPLPGRPMDPITKWLVITRSCVFSMTLISALLGGLLAANDGYISLGRLAIVALGLCLAHAANNMVNDLFDTLQGVDTKDYPRANYAPHPILDGLISKNGLIAAIIFCNVLDLAIAVYLTSIAGWPIMAFAVAGLLTSVFYVAPPLKLKHRGLGEPAIFLIWGPLMICGSYYAMSETLTWGVVLASCPYGIAVTSVLMGKHLDKQDKDRAKNVHTLPVVLGDARARSVTQLMIWSYYLLIVTLVSFSMLPALALLALISIPRANRFIQTLGAPPPATPAEAFALAKDVIPADLRARFDPAAPVESFPLWPLWYVAWGVWWVRVAGGWFVGGLVLSTVISLF